MRYFIDSEIYNQGKKCLPRRVILECISKYDGYLIGYDSDYNAHILQESDIFKDTLDTNEYYYLENYKESIWIQEQHFGICVYRRKEDGDFSFLGIVPYSQKDNLDNAIMKL